MKLIAIILMLSFGAVAQKPMTLGQERAELRHRQSFCRKNPGQIYHGFQCPSDREAATSEQWIDDHPKYHQSEANGRFMADYIKENNLSPAVAKSYDKAFSALKKQGVLELNR